VRLKVPNFNLVGASNNFSLSLTQNENKRFYFSIMNALQRLKKAAESGSVDPYEWQIQVEYETEVSSRQIIIMAQLMSGHEKFLSI
jgi:hypothetical protein